MPPKKASPRSGAAASPSRSPSRTPKQKSPPAKKTPPGKWLIDTAAARTFRFSSEGMLMYPISKVLCPPLRKLGVTPNQITLFNVLVGLGSGYGLGNLSPSAPLPPRFTFPPCVYTPDVHHACATVTKNWPLAWVLNFGHQLLDAMDGTMARMFNMQTELGAKLDEFTDIFFGAVTSLGALYVRDPRHDPPC
eukprot:COSAG05_NODE_1100_length_5884_cov_7.338634_6_plen_192_part_00